MPATPATTTRLGLPRYDNNVDPADFATQVNAISDLLDTLVARRDEVLPIGGQAPYGGLGDPSGDHWLLCDGRELNVADFPELQAVIGFRYSPGGNDPGGGHFHLPDKRGRGSMGPDTMGTAQGSAGRLTTNAVATKSHPNAVGQNGGAERHRSIAVESGSPAHGHTAASGIESQKHTHPLNASLVNAVSGYSQDGTYGNYGFGVTSLNNTGMGFDDRDHTHAITVNPSAATPADVDHNNVQPYEVDNWIIRVR